MVAGSSLGSSIIIITAFFSLFVIVTLVLRGGRGFGEDDVIKGSYGYRTREYCLSNHYYPQNTSSTKKKFSKT